MKTVLFLVVLISALQINTIFAQDAHKHQNHKKAEGHKSDKGLSLNNGKKWEIDSTMKANMDAIYTEFQKKPQDYSKLSSVIFVSTEKIVTNCKLKPKADETYHVVLAELLAAAEELKDKQRIEHALKKVNNAFHIYHEYFNHPGHVSGH